MRSPRCAARAALRNTTRGYTTPHTTTPHHPRTYHTTPRHSTTTLTSAPEARGSAVETQMTPLESTQNRHKINPKSTKNRQKIDRESIQIRPKQLKTSVGFIFAPASLVPALPKYIVVLGSLFVGKFDIGQTSYTSRPPGTPRRPPGDPRRRSKPQETPRRPHETPKIQQLTCLKEGVG